MPAFDPSLDLQKAIRTRLLASTELMALIPADNVLDTNGRPERIPCIHIGEGQTVYRRWDATAYATLHVWFEEPGLFRAKTATGLIVDALRVDAQRDGVLTLDHFVCYDLRGTDTRYLRDPHGSYSHVVINAAGIVRAK